MATTTVNQPIALPTISGTTVSGGTITYVAGTANTDRVWCGTSVALGIWPWYGSAISAGGTVTFTGVGAGVTFYCYSPTEPNAVTITLQ